MTVKGCRGCPAIATVLGTPGSQNSLSSLSMIGGIFRKGVEVVSVDSMMNILFLIIPEVFIWGYKSSSNILAISLVKLTTDNCPGVNL